jgi:hypothetical protein
VPTCPPPAVTNISVPAAGQLKLKEKCPLASVVTLVPTWVAVVPVDQSETVAPTMGAVAPVMTLPVNAFVPTPPLEEDVPPDDEELLEDEVPPLEDELLLEDAPLLLEDAPLLLEDAPLLLDDAPPEDEEAAGAPPPPPPPPHAISAKVAITVRDLPIKAMDRDTI